LKKNHTFTSALTEQSPQGRSRFDEHASCGAVRDRGIALRVAGNFLQAARGSSLRVATPIIPVLKIIPEKIAPASQSAVTRVASAISV
jgi:hypothetical protein